MTDPVGVADTCADILFIDLQQPGATKAVVVSALRCDADQVGLKLSIGPGYATRPELDHHVVLNTVEAGGCLVVGGLSAEAWGLPFEATCAPDGEWSNYHAVMTTGVGGLIDSVEVPTDAQPDKAGRLQVDDAGSWHPVSELAGCEYLAL